MNQLRGIKTKPRTGRRSLLLAGLAFGLAASASAWAQAADYDVLIRGGRVFDGSLKPGVLADVAIKGDRIVKVGDIPASATADQVVDAKGRYVTPGFIDPHSHAAPGIETAELAAAQPILYQGITTVMLNPDGGGPGDLRPQVAAIEKHGPGVNVAPMIGHNGVRKDVMDLANRKATPAELARMQALVKDAMDFGAFGLSSGPFYVPGKYSDTAELVTLAKVAAPYPHAFHISHIRDESSYDVGVLGAIEELITVSREAKIPGVVTHMKMLGPSVWGKSVEAIKLINEARAQGLSIWADQYAYAASGSGLQPSLLPGWAQEGGKDAIAKRLQNPEQRALIRKEMVSNMARRGGPNSMMIRGYDPDPSLEGKRLDEIARARLQDPVDTAIDMLIKGGAGIVSFNMNEKDVENLMKQPWTMTSSDGALVKFGEGAEHPRAYGAFPRKLRRYVVEKKVISWEQAIHSATALTAEVFAIKDRGVIRPGAYADVLVFNPETVRDVATYEKPHAYSEGMEFVFVNGKAAVANGKVTPQRYGKVLLRTRGD
ncbi:N-acyl-D-amino-acid deacylase family protein [Phenylobacterium sp.]|uniref:N-acyl-D-amino-acid deacylase family protein n=1 Tax=Phenylobacterium sp. TaxID=1871053 RepID=UPI002C001C52|nr:amidohydrolase family protein [Phenylobacterium sp.]HVI33717.1 amidohydrolase family protein [Phenylobacterium sp.]